MKFSILSFFVLWSAVSQASYTCSTRSNPDRGFPTPLKIALSDEGQLSVNGKVLPGKLESARIDSSNPAFASTLQYIGEPDVSGLTPSTYKKVTQVQVDRLPTPDGDEIILFRIFAGRLQVGGTFTAAGHGTACLPK